MNKEEINKLLWEIPEEAADYAVDATELDSEDITEERIEGLIGLLDHDNEVVQFDAARILTSWGKDAGFDKLAAMLVTSQVDGMISHRLHPYDDTKRFVLGAFISYWATKSDEGDDQGVREKIYSYVIKIISDAGHEYFDLGIFIDMIARWGLSEYKEPLKQYLANLLEKPENQFYKIQEVISYLRPKEPDFVKNLLEQHGKTFSDFGLKE